MTPFEAVTGRAPGLAGLPVWGTKVWVHDTSTGKLGVRAKDARWVGFDAQSRGHRVYWPDGRRVTVERNVRFSVDEPTVVYEDDGVELEGEGVLRSRLPRLVLHSSRSRSCRQRRARCASASLHRRLPTCLLAGALINTYREGSLSQRRTLQRMTTSLRRSRGSQWPRV